MVLKNCIIDILKFKTGIIPLEICIGFLQAPGALPLYITLKYSHNLQVILLLLGDINLSYKSVIQVGYDYNFLGLFPSLF